MGQLILVPTPLAGGDTLDPLLNPYYYLKESLPEFDGVFVESLKGGRSFLKALGLQKEMIVLDKNTKDHEWRAFIEEMKGQTWLLISDAGFPCVADPGYSWVSYARRLGYKVKMTLGQSSILMALALSGLPGQNFSFNGYLPRREEPLIEKLQELEKQSKDRVEIFIETPYRNQNIIKSCLDTLSSETQLCIAAGLGSTQERVKTQKIKRWKEEGRHFLDDETPAVYLLHRSPKKPSDPKKKPYSKAKFKKKR